MIGSSVVENKAEVLETPSACVSRCFLSNSDLTRIFNQNTTKVNEFRELFGSAQAYGVLPFYK